VNITMPGRTEPAGRNGSDPEPIRIVSVTVDMRPTARFTKASASP
jgi:hypothetical protein